MITATGAAAVRELGFFDGTLRNSLAGAAILAGLAALAWIVSRYVAAHADSIGEARFDTRNERDPPVWCDVGCDLCR